MRTPPGPRDFTLGLRHLRSLNVDPLGFYPALAREYGDLAMLRFGPKRLCLASHPDLVREVLVTKGRSFRKWERITRVFASVDGKGLI
ncbi:MAG: cytochrome P450, partial [Candidatus Binatia bacterium]